MSPWWLALPLGIIMVCGIAALWNAKPTPKLGEPGYRRPRCYRDWR